MNRNLKLQWCLLLASLLGFQKGYAQKSEFYLGLGGGLISAVLQPQHSTLVNPLLAFPKPGASFSMEWHFQMKNRFGYGSFIRFTKRHKQPIQAAFSRALEQVFPTDYATVTLYGMHYKHSPMIEAYFFGFYTLIKHQWRFRPRLLVGISTVRVVNAEVVLKRQNSNQQSILKLLDEEHMYHKYYTKWSAGLGMMIERQLTKDWSLFATADFTGFSANIKYRQTLEDQVTGNMKMYLLENRSNVQMIQLQVGILARI